MTIGHKAIVVLTALAGPLGALVGAFALASLFNAVQGGMAGLGGLVIGLMVGPLVVPFLVFVLLLLTPLGDGVTRRGLAIATMAGVMVLLGLVVFLVLVLGANTDLASNAVPLLTIVVFLGLIAGSIMSIRRGLPAKAATTDVVSP